MQDEIAAGNVLAGKSRVERVLGRGGMGVVVAAHQIHLDEKVAINFLLPEAVASPEVVGRFVREARAAVRIKSEHVARVSDVGTLERGEPYTVSEYLDGSDLCKRAKRSPRRTRLASCTAILARSHSEQAPTSAHLELRGVLSPELAGVSLGGSL